jgi:hypothetical protein
MRSLKGTGGLLLTGLWLLWKGVSGNIAMDRFGEPMLPRWSYIAAGLFLLIISLLLFLAFYK